MIITFQVRIDFGSEKIRKIKDFLLKIKGEWEGEN